MLTMFYCEYNIYEICTFLHTVFQKFCVLDYSILHDTIRENKPEGEGKSKYVVVFVSYKQRWM